MSDPSRIADLKGIHVTEHNQEAARKEQGLEVSGIVDWSGHCSNKEKQT